MYSIKERQEMDIAKHYKTDRTWARDQLKAAGSTSQTERIVLAVIDAVEGVSVDRGFDLEALLMDALSLLRGHPLVTDDPGDVRLVDLVLGEFAVKDRVQVRVNAYDGAHGMKHNGRVGRIAHVQGDRVKVVYDGETADLATNHKMENLQKLV